MYMTEVMGFIKKQFGFNKAYIIVQDTLWAQGTGKGLDKWFKENGWEVASYRCLRFGFQRFFSIPYQGQGSKGPGDRDLF